MVVNIKRCVYITHNRIAISFAQITAALHHFRSEQIRAVVNIIKAQKKGSGFAQTSAKHAKLL